MHIFYIDSLNIVQEAIKSNTSNQWVNGSVGAANWKASESSSVGFEACYNDLYYNDAGNGNGIRLFYGVDNTTVHELVYSIGTQEWRGGYSFTGANGDGGVTCAGVGSGITYLYALNERNQLGFWWRDFASNTLNNPKHPPNIWVTGMYRLMSLITLLSSCGLGTHNG